jgi:hypothetical protein
MTLLNLASLESYEKLYDWTPGKYSVIEKEVLAQLAKIRGRYSP